MKKIAVTIAIPDDLDFSALQLERDPVTHALAFTWGPIRRICEASGLDVALMEHEDNVSGLIVAWYAEHRRSGGAADLVAEQILAEVLAEDAFGAYRVQSGPGSKH